MSNVDGVINTEAHDDDRKEHFSESELPFEDLHKSEEGDEDREEHQETERGDHDVLRGEEENDEAEAGGDDHTIDTILLNGFLGRDPAPGIIGRLND